MFFIVFAHILSCRNDVLPKPSAQLSLEYKTVTYDKFNQQSPFDFDINNQAKIISKGNNNFELHYPKMKATIYISYKPVSNNIDNLLRDAQKLTYSHTVKADEILEQPFMNRDNKVFGMFYDVNGNAATNAQFYVTDSTKHFVDCSAYFYAKPNFDSILPAVGYLKKDMRHLMETLQWK
ncbi:MAG: gliding motility lipoprotein GldD [Bacteroidota bacterium]